uniref:Uncharacterized protein n=1 Tax=Ditylenchus dipsaci TaxID=166011 RepID=A0A915D746_9BILA
MSLDAQVPSPTYVLRPPKIIQNNPDSPSVVELGLRRSARNRLPRLQRSLHQRPIYERDAEGNYNIIGVNEVVVKDKRLKKYGVADPIVADERSREMKNRKKLETIKKAELKKRRFT